MKKLTNLSSKQKQAEAERLLDELVNEIGPRLKAKGITEENVVAEMRKVRKKLSRKKYSVETSNHRKSTRKGYRYPTRTIRWANLRKLSGVVSLGGDALADSEALHDGD